MAPVTVTNLRHGFVALSARLVLGLQPNAPSCSREVLGTCWACIQLKHLMLTEDPRACKDASSAIVACLSETFWAQLFRFNRISKIARPVFAPNRQCQPGKKSNFGRSLASLLTPS